MPVYLSLGSNVGTRLVNVRSAVSALRAEPGVNVLRESRVYETEPVGDARQDLFLNMAVAVETMLGPLEFLDRIQAIEKQVGRVPARRWGPRVIDIDIVLWDDLVIDSDRLTIPHPEFRARAFVLAPLSEIAPVARDPVTGLTVLELSRQSPSDQVVRLFGLSRA